MATKTSDKGIGGIVVGIFILILGFGVLMSNEISHVNSMKVSSEASDNVVDVSSSAIDSANNGKLVATNGSLEVSDEYVMDDVFQVKTKTAKLVRVVEMYQWEEKINIDSNGESIYTYTTVWSDKVLDSKGYHDSRYENPIVKPCDNETFTAEDVTVGDYVLSNTQLKELDSHEQLQLDSSMQMPPGYTIYDNAITNSEDVENPQIGDVRITYRYNNDVNVSILAGQSGDTFVDYKTKSGNVINKIVSGTYDGNELVSQLEYKEDTNSSSLWIFRILGIVFLVIGMIAILLPVSAFASVPIIGGLANGVVIVVAALLGVSLSCVVMAITWIMVGPIVGVVLLLAAGLLLLVIKKVLDSNKKNTFANTDGEVEEILDMGPSQPQASAPAEAPIMTNEAPTLEPTSQPQTSWPAAVETPVSNVEAPVVSTPESEIVSAPVEPATEPIETLDTLQPAPEPKVQEPVAEPVETLDPDDPLVTGTAEPKNK